MARKSNDSEDEWVLREVRVPKGTHLSESKDTPGAERTLLRQDGSNKLLGPPESRPVEIAEESYDDYPYVVESELTESQKELTPAQQQLADAIAEVITEVAREIVLPLVRDVLAPTLRVKIAEMATALKSKSVEIRSKAKERKALHQSPGSVQAGTTEVEQSTALPKIEMSIDDFREYMIRAMAAEQFATQLKSMLREVRVVDHSLDPELSQTINLVLEGRLSELEDKSVAVLVQFLGGHRQKDGKLVLPPPQEH